jgi:broad specificity phosphatase PhoE
LSESDKALVTDFTWNYNPKEFFFPKKLSDDDNPDAPMEWINPEDPNVKVILIRHSQTLFNIEHDTLMKALMSKQMNKLKWVWKFTQ